MFEEFEVVCPKCGNILRLSAFDYTHFIKRVDMDDESHERYVFPCFGCDTELQTDIITSLKTKKEV